MTPPSHRVNIDLRHARRVAREEADQVARERAGFGDAWRRYVRDHEHNDPRPVPARVAYARRALGGAGEPDDALARRVADARKALYGGTDDALQRRVEDAQEAIYGPGKGKGS